jgi:hypothetical protein
MINPSKAIKKRHQAQVLPKVTRLPQHAQYNCALRSLHFFTNGVRVYSFQRRLEVTLFEALLRPGLNFVRARRARAYVAALRARTRLNPVLCYLFLLLRPLC